MQNNKLKIILTGGGTGGSVAPLLAIKNAIDKKATAEFLFVGTQGGVEENMARSAGLPFCSILSGKLRRYFSWQNFVDILKIKIAFFQSLKIIRNFKPDIIISAGSFVSVPLIWAAVLGKTKILVHQQDVRPGLANKLMASFAGIITVVFKKSLGDYGKKARLAANPIRLDFFQKHDKNKARAYFGLKMNMDTVLFLGGGMGAVALNDLATQMQNKNFQILLVGGKGKVEKNVTRDGLIVKEFLNSDELVLAYAAADLVVCRAGMGTLSEIAFLSKPAILIPMPNSHQEENTEEFARNNAALVFAQMNLTPLILEEKISELLADKHRLSEYGRRAHNIIPTDGGESIAEAVLAMI